MILILSGADGSNCGLGQIEIPAPIQDETNLILSKQTRYNISSEQTLALNQFIYELKQAGLWSKVGIFMPVFMGNSLTELSYDVISDTCLLQDKDHAVYNVSDNTLAGQVNVSIGKNAFGNFAAVSKFSDPYVLAQHFYWKGAVENSFMIRGTSSGPDAGPYIASANFGYTGANNVDLWCDNTRIRDLSEGHNYNKKGLCCVFNIVSNPIRNSKMNGTSNLEFRNPPSSMTDNWSAMTEPTYIRLNGVSSTTAKNMNIDFYLFGNNMNLTDEEQLSLYTSTLKLRKKLEELDA